MDLDFFSPDLDFSHWETTKINLQKKSFFPDPPKTNIKKNGARYLFHTPGRIWGKKWYGSTFFSHPQPDGKQKNTGWGTTKNRSPEKIVFSRPPPQKTNINKNGARKAKKN